LAPAIRPGTSFEVRMTPKRAGTFMYHTHFNELAQQLGGLVGALIVLEPGETWDPTRDLVVLVSDSKLGDPLNPVINGASEPAAKELRVGTTYRLRLADIAVFQHSLLVRVKRDSSLVSWRAVAKDGFTLPASQATTQASVVRVTSGETADFELTPDTPGELTLEVAVPAPGPQSPPRQPHGDRRQPGLCRSGIAQSPEAAVCRDEDVLHEIVDFVMASQDPEPDGCDVPAELAEQIGHAVRGLPIHLFGGLDNT
jgi:uncharacterized cupredoxin-like copper-binding protein